MVEDEDEAIRAELRRLMERNQVTEARRLLNLHDGPRILNPPCSIIHSSLLESAVYAGKTDFATLFLEAGADINRCWNVDGGCLFAAINGEQPGSVDFLLRNGARHDAIDYEQRNAVVYCVSATMEATSWNEVVLYEAETIAILRVLHQHGLDFNQADNIGYTALHYCADSYYTIMPSDYATPIATVLLECGADPAQPDLMNETPLAMAERKGYKALVRLFHQYSL